MTSSESRRPLSLLAGFAALKLIGVAVLLVLIGVPVLVAVVVGAAVAALGVWLLASRSHAVVLWAAGAVPADEADQPRLHNVVEGLCVTAGIDKPSLHVVDVPAANTMVSARLGGDVALVVTTGLLDVCDRMALEGVLAHQLCRTKDSDVAADTLVATTAGSVALAADLCLRPRGDDGRPGALGKVGSGLYLFAGVWASMLHRALGPDQTVARDLAAVTMTRFPPGLVEGLEQMAARGTASPSGLRATAHLWLAAPVALRPGDGPYSELNRRFDRHPTLPDRIEALREL